MYDVEEKDLDDITPYSIGVKIFQAKSSKNSHNLEKS